MKVAGAINYEGVVIFKLSYYGFFLQLNRIVCHTIGRIKVNILQKSKERLSFSLQKNNKTPTSESRGILGGSFIVEKDEWM